MSDTILGGDVTIYYLAEDRQKRFEWTGGATATRTLNELYSAALKKIAELTQASEGTPYNAVTDAEYQIGSFDAGDKDPWFIDRTTMEHIIGTSGLPMSLTTVSWTRVTSTNTGIVKIVCAIGALVQGDIGDTCTHTSGDTGTILDINQTTGEVWIRPTDDTAANDWDTASGTFDADTSTNTSGTVSAAAVTGESIWAGVESIATLQANTRPYVYQDGAEVIAYKGTDKWWFDGHINTNFYVQDIGTLIDEGYVTVLAHQFTKQYNYWELDLSSGKPKPAPLGTNAEPQNTAGYRQFLTDAETGGGWSASDVGTVMRVQGDTDNQAIITNVSGTGPNYTVQYYLIGSLDGFADDDVMETEDSVKDMTIAGDPTLDGDIAKILGGSLTVRQNGEDDFYMGRQTPSDIIDGMFEAELTLRMRIFYHAKQKYLTDMHKQQIDEAAGDLYISQATIQFNSLVAGSSNTLMFVCNECVPEYDLDIGEDRAMEFTVTYEVKNAYASYETDQGAGDITTDTYF